MIKTSKIDEETASIPSLKTGETGRVEAFCTLDATSAKVTDIEATTSIETYGVYYKETQTTYRTRLASFSYLWI
ncbi:MAG: hypothetical protein M0Q91_09765 [Methanoregula sp.]|nr:hypothetical protein [Methanoregula sp.]